MRENKYWLMANVVHSADFSYWQFQATEWTVYGAVGNNVSEGDIVFIADGEQGIYAWGYVSEIILFDSDDQSSVKISRGAIQPSLVSKSQILQNKDISNLLLFKGGRFTFLTNKQVKIINSFLPYSIPKPPSPRKQQFILNKPIEENEDLYNEFKEINVNKIPDIAYDYAQAFLNQEGGRIYIGIRDNDKTVVGNEIDYSKMDEIGKKVENKLLSLNPSIYPYDDYSITFHPIIDENGNGIKDFYIFELEIKPSTSKNYRSASGKYSVKTYSGKKRIE